ncbi:MAG: hypothetical protein IAF08_15155 [Rhizobacter sp.]|nr:hypothetical protein [Chlorobiales bacterium]
MTITRRSFLRSCCAAALASLAVLNATACNNAETPTSPPPAAASSFFVSPAATDAAIDTYPDSHYVYLNPDAAAQNKLVVFLPGAGGIPQNYELFVQTAGDMGYHAIGLMYPNPTDVYNIGTSGCQESADADCFYKVRYETLTGADSSTLFVVTPANSILNRLKKLLMYLAAAYPAANWGQYLDATGNPVWTKIIMGGHSQGAGHSVFISKVYPVARVVMLANKDWNTITNQPAPWYALPNASASNNVYGFTHSQDEFADQQVVWTALQLGGFGGIVNVDTAVPSYANTRTLTSDAVPAFGGANTASYHSSVAVDKFTPKNADGTPAFKPVWQYMLRF